jgi:hypothetical protein
MQRLTNPLPLFIDTRGDLLDGGYVWVGPANEDPEGDDAQLEVFLDQDLTVQIPQPLRTLGGMIVSGANAVFVYLAEDDYSMTIRDANEVLVAHVPSIAVAGGPTYQPLDSDLTAIADLTTTPYGRALLTLANQAALQAALGLPAALPLAGGTMLGNILRQGKGVHVYHNDAAMTGGRIFVTAAGAADPTSQPGDIWFQTA